MQLSDFLISKILMLNKKKFNASQISFLTDVSITKIKRVLNAVKINKQEGTKKIFDTDERENWLF